MAKILDHIEHFWNRVDKTSYCWIWTGAKKSTGYGKVKVNNRDWLAHRYSYYISTGIEPGNLLVCHHCDNPPCVRPNHLFLGTSSENALDSSRKGRHHSIRKECCPKGHLYSGNNLYLDPRGFRQCRTCRK